MGYHNLFVQPAFYIILKPQLNYDLLPAKRLFIKARFQDIQRRTGRKARRKAYASRKSLI